jgi:hypothetical protein
MFGRRMSDSETEYIVESRARLAQRLRGLEFSMKAIPELRRAHVINCKQVC